MSYPVSTWPLLVMQGVSTAAACRSGDRNLGTFLDPLAVVRGARVVGLMVLARESLAILSLLTRRLRCVDPGLCLVDYNYPKRPPLLIRAACKLALCISCRQRM